MNLPKTQPKETMDQLTQLMVITMEECGELIQVCSKILRSRSVLGHIPEKNIKNRKTLPFSSLRLCLHLSVSGLLQLQVTQKKTTISVFYKSNRIPVTLPLFIAMTALARMIILQGKDPSDLLYEAGAIVLVALACLIIRIRPPENYRANIEE